MLRTNEVSAHKLKPRKLLVTPVQVLSLPLAPRQQEAGATRQPQPHGLATPRKRIALPRPSLEETDSVASELPSEAEATFVDARRELAKPSVGDKHLTSLDTEGHSTILSKGVTGMPRPEGSHWTRFSQVNDSRVLASARSGAGTPSRPAVEDLLTRAHRSRSQHEQVAELEQSWNAYKQSRERIQ